MCTKMKDLKFKLLLIVIFHNSTFLIYNEIHIFVWLLSMVHHIIKGVQEIVLCFSVFYLCSYSTLLYIYCIYNRWFQYKPLGKLSRFLLTDFYILLPQLLGLPESSVRFRMKQRAWLIRKVEITYMKFFEPSSACSIRNCTFTKHFQ